MVPWDSGVKRIARISVPFFPKGAEKVLVGALSFSADVIKVVLLPDGYVVDPAHEFLADVGTTIGTAQALTTKSISGGVFSADDSNFDALAAGSTVGAALIFKDTGSAATSPLLMCITDVVGLPLATNGSGLALRWSRGAAKIVSLVPA